MKTYNEILKAAKALGNDVVIYDVDNTIEIDFKDCAGFDNNGERIMRKYDNPKAVEKFVEMICSESSYLDPLFCTYYFNGFSVEFDFTSLYDPDMFD